MPFIRLSNPWLLTAAPALAYAVAYLDRLGEAQARAIPLDWITVSATDALSRTAGVIAGLGLMFAALSFAESDKHKNGTRRWHHLLVGLGLGGLVFMLRIGWTTAILAVLVGAFLSAFGWFGVGTAVSTPESRGPVEIKKRDGIDLGEIELPFLLIVALLIITLLPAWGSGYYRATQSENVLTDATGERIVLASYGDRVVLGDLTNEPGEALTVGHRRWLAVSPSEETSGLVAVDSSDTVTWR